ncbi:MAG: class I SAM-dependent methyltransferase [Desulfuromonadaceae bacterium]|nr:class I SAM-dependent methyltransferase [Desulfuromonadaceae bacterium]
MKNIDTLPNPSCAIGVANPEVLDYRQRIKHSSQAAEKYQHRKIRKHQAEIRLIERALQTLPPLKSILDAPCGVGRACLLLANHGYDVTGIDMGEAALLAARAAIDEAQADVTIEQADLEQLPYDDTSFDACLCFRFIHHLPTDELRESIIGELCRVTRQYILISYLSPLSVTSMRRNLAERLGGKPSIQHRTSLGVLLQHFKRQGFSLHQDLAQLPLLHSLHLAVFKRDRSRTSEL